MERNCSERILLFRWRAELGPCRKNVPSAGVSLGNLTGHPPTNVRNLWIHGSTGPWEDFAEVNFSGSPTGGSDDVSTQGYQYDVPAQKTDFVFEVTKWESTGADTAVMSATFSGGLAGILGAGPIVISNGVITDIEVVVFPDPF